MADQSQNIKQQFILSAGKELFWKHGVKRVTVEEICVQANVSKMTFYKFFMNKRELAYTVLDNIVNEALNEYKELINSESSFNEKIDAMLKMKLEGTKDISQEFIADIYLNKNLGLIPLVEEQRRKSMEITIGFLLDSQKKGFIRKGIKINFIIHFFTHMFEMITDPDLISEYEKPQDLIMEVMEFFFYGIGAKQL